MLNALIIAITCWLLGFAILGAAARRFTLQIPISLLTGAGFALGAAIPIALVQIMGTLSLGLRMGTMVCVGLGVMAGGAMMWLIGGRSILSSAVQAWRDLAWDRLSLVMLLLMAANLMGALVNNLIRPIFPWDAFTTWMYRSKAWALDDQITAMTFVPDWLAAGGGSGYAIYAHHYPTALSVLAAMTSALSGSWDPAAASALWTFAGVALTLGVYGCCRWQGLPSRSCVLASFLVASAPLLNMHMALAGYADLWMALYAGLGLSVLLVGQTTHHKTALIIGVLLLLLGTQLKTEGWIWLGVGVVFMLLDAIRLRFGGLWLVGMLAAAAALVWLTGITALDLGPGGKWGLFDGALRAGHLGSYPLRPYNPLGDYWDALFQQNNFGLLPPLCTLGLIVLVLRRSPKGMAHLLMTGLIVATQMVIFGLSSFSEYAETGTAINRLVIHFLPVFALTAVTALDEMGLSKRAAAAERDAGNNHLASAFQGRLNSDIWFICLLSVALLLVMASTNGPERSRVIRFDAAKLVPLVGSGVLDSHGRWQFSESPMAFAVLGSLQPLPNGIRFADLTVMGKSASATVFYWRNGNGKDMHRVAIPNHGRSLIDLQNHPRWNPTNVVEWGFVIPESRFDSVSVGDVAFSSALGFSNLLGLFNRWLAPPVLNQSTLNNLAVMLAGPTVLVWLTLALGLIALTVIAVDSTGGSLVSRMLGVQSLGHRGVLLVSIMVLTGGLWTQAFLRNAAELATHPEGELVENLAAGHGAYSIAKVALKGLDSNRATIVVPSTAREEFNAQKMPLLLLPQRAVFTNVGPRQVPKNWAGQIMLLGYESERLDALETAIEKKLKRPLVTVVKKEGFRLVE